MNQQNKERKVAKSRSRKGRRWDRSSGGPRLLESVYEEAVVYERQPQGLGVDRQKVVPLVCQSKRLAGELRFDLLVQNRVIVEFKPTREDSTLLQERSLTPPGGLNLEAE